MNALDLKKTLLCPPGDTIQEHIEFIGMSQAELAERMGRPVTKINELIKGKIPITKKTATKLEYVLGIDANFWLNKERLYQQELLEIEQMEFLESCKSWIKGFPINMLKKMNLLPNSNKKTDLTEGLLKFFRVASPLEWTSIYEGQSLAFKIELRYTTDPKAISTWLRIGELQAEELNLGEFNKKELTNALPIIQEIAFKKPANWLEELQKVCASFGVALVFTPCVSKAPIFGAARWIKNKTIPLIQLTDRKKDYHAFWFSFYHELAHIRYHNKADIFIDGIDNISPDQNKEKEADEFATRMLVNEAVQNQLSSIDFPSPNALIEISSEHKTHLSILISHLQRLGKIDYKSRNFNQLKTKVEFKEVVFKDQHYFK
jgi:HTH-type transcriptional regulator / antitoxin HigA